MISQKIGLYEIYKLAKLSDVIDCCKKFKLKKYISLRVKRGVESIRVVSDKEYSLEKYLKIMEGVVGRK